MLYSSDKWYVLLTMPKAEKKVRDYLERKNLEVFLPLYKRVVQWSDRKKKLFAPLFPGYIFVRLDNKSFHKVYDTPGVLKFVTIQGVKDTVPDDEIDTIKLLIQGKPEICERHFEPGQVVEVFSGPFLGLKGELIKYKGKDRVLVHLNTVNKSAMLEILPNQLRKCPGKKVSKVTA
ncbi:MAG: UpxY family transcription antiterminator [Bacteroidota bacterium]